MRKLVVIFVIPVVFSVFSPVLVSAQQGLAAWWKFDKADGQTVLDSISQNRDDIAGNFRYVKGVKGSGLKCDGRTTRIVRQPKDAPVLKDAFTIEAWIAPQAYPYNWCAIVNQGKDHKAGYFFGIDNWARVGLHVSVDGKWLECNSNRKMVPFMTKWTHIAGVFNKDKGLAVYVDGKLAAEKKAKGKAEYAENMEMQIARNHKKTRMDPETLVRREVNFPTSYSFDGIIDELKIYNRALSAEEVQKAYAKNKPDQAPALNWRKLPSPEKKDNFGAAYTKLKFYPEWDDLWRVADHPDIVVNFEDSDYQMIFWRGTNFNMNLVTENGKWVGDQSVEGSAGGKTIGCCEHMSDKQCRYAYVQLIENNDARVVVHWRYAVCDVLYRIAQDKPGDGWADEYYYIYPDGVAVRVFTAYGFYGHHSVTEPAALNNPGERAEDNLNVDALIQANMKGQIRRQFWDPWPGNGKIAAPFSNDLPNANINIVNFKSQSKPFYIYEPGTRVIPYGGGLIEVRDYSKFPTWNHWPVCQAPSDGRYAFFTDRVSSSAVTSPEPKMQVSEDGTSHGSFIMGLTDESIEKLAPIARAWLQSPELEVKTDAFSSPGYSKDQRAFLFTKEKEDAETLIFKVESSEESPLVHPAFVIKNWGEKKAELQINGKTIEPGKVLKQGLYRRLDGTDLIIFLNKEIMEPVRIKISPVK